MRTIRLCMRLIFLCGLLNNCATITGGNGSETTNGYIIGSLIKNNGSYAMNVRVMLVPNNFNPVKDGSISNSLTDTTDEAGKFVFRVPDKGIYNVEALDPATGDRTLICNISVFGHDTVFTPTATIQRPGAIKAQLPTSSVAAYVYLPGTTRFGRIGGSIAIIDSVPAGSFTALYYVNQSDTTQNHSIKTNFTVTSACTTFIAANHAWNFSKSLYINTTLSGAAVSGNVYSFPVLVRLSAGNFVFNQAKSGGEDVRFVKEDGSPLPFEIERWDPAAQRAEIWVKVDTVYGNDSTHYFTMLWGDSSVTGSSNGAAVFDTANGFAAVWHLDTDCSDATAGNHGGTSFGAADTSGIIGGAKKFDGRSYIQVPGLLGAPPSITISAWVRLDSTSGSGQDIVSLGDAVAIRAYRTAPDGTAGFFCTNVSDSDTVHVFTNTGASILKTGWRYLVYTVDAARHVQSMYIDGTFQSSTNDSNPIDYGLGLNTVLGAHGNNKTQSYAFGCIDEARVCRVARSADWIKLCYMNQKEQDALVKFR